MGERFLPTTRMNPKGFWHDLDFELSWTDGSTHELIARRQALGVPWGVNTRRSAKAEVFASCNPKVVLASRSPQANKASCEKWLKWIPAEKDREELEQAASLFTEVLEVDFDKLVEAPSLVVNEIAEFIGLPVTQQAVDFVDPQLRHHE